MRSIDDREHRAQVSLTHTYSLLSDNSDNSTPTSGGGGRHMLLVRLCVSVRLLREEQRGTRRQQKKLRKVHTHTRICAYTHTLFTYRLERRACYMLACTPYRTRAHTRECRRRVVVALSVYMCSSSSSTITASQYTYFADNLLTFQLPKPRTPDLLRN